MAGCPRCEDMHIIDPIFLEETKAAFAQLTADLVIFAQKHKIDYKDMPILTTVARTIRIIESL
jgi:hypothetical protein